MDINQLIDSGALGDFEMSFRSKELTSLEGLENFSFITSLDLANNKISSLKGIEKLKNLKKLIISQNLIESLEQLKDLEKLEELYCINNKIKSLKGLENLLFLKKLEVGVNELTSLEYLPVSVSNLDCSHNKNLADISEVLKIKDGLAINCLDTKACTDAREIAKRKNMPNEVLWYNKAEYKKYLRPILRAIELEKHLVPGDPKRGAASLSETGLFDFNN